MGEGYRGVEYGSKPLKKCLLAELGSRDGWGGCKLRSSIVLVETVIPVRAAPWAVEREGSGGAEALLWPEPVEWDAESDFTACNKRATGVMRKRLAADDVRTARHKRPRGKRENCYCTLTCRPGWVAVVRGSRRLSSSFAAFQLVLGWGCLGIRAC